MAERKKGKVSRVAGPVVTAQGISPRMYDVIQVGEMKLMGEVIKLVGDKTIIQVTRTSHEAGRGRHRGPRDGAGTSLRRRL
jgi:V/A-type H+-transporting ATPase subunit A